MEIVIKEELQKLINLGNRGNFTYRQLIDAISMLEEKGSTVENLFDYCTKMVIFKLVTMRIIYFNDSEVFYLDNNFIYFKDHLTREKYSH